jgi:hypothetical protein
MSRRHHGRPHHSGRHHAASARPAPATDQPRPTSVDASAPGAERVTKPADAESPKTFVPAAAERPIAQPATAQAPTNRNGAANGMPSSPVNGGPNGQGDRANGCTAPQLRRFIKSRPYVPMHELRRRFAIDGGDDDVTQVRLEQSAVYVGLPDREGTLLGELLRGGEIGYELSLDPRSPIVVGVYPMRPVPRG